MKQAEPGYSKYLYGTGLHIRAAGHRTSAVCAHLLGQIIEAFGVEHVLWGTDSIWSGTPQWQIEAFRRFQMPDQLIEQHGYVPLTREVKAQIFGLNAAKLFGIDVSATRNQVPSDYVGRIRMSYLEEGPEPSHRLYGWIRN